MSSIPQIFDAAATRAQKYRQHPDAFLTEQLALRGVERLQALASVPETVAVMGPLHTALTEAFPATTFIPAAIAADGRLQIEGTAGCILDLGTLALVNDLPGALAQIRAALPPKGVFFSLLYGGTSLHEVRMALLEVETELTGGGSPRLHPTLSGEMALQLLQRAAFEAPITDRELMSAGYKSLRDLARDLRAAGLSNQLATRSHATPPRALFAAADARWQAQAPAPNGRAMATFEIIALTGWK